MPLFDYKIVRSKKLSSSTTIRINEKDGVVVRAPFWVPEFSIRNFVNDRADWIVNQLQKVKTKKIDAKKYVPGETHLFFGREYPLEVSHSTIPTRTKVLLHEEKILVTIFVGHDEEKKRNEIKDGILRWYLEEGIGVITEKVNFYSSKLNVTYGRIDLKKVSSIWGSCSASNNLSFNRKLVMAPHEIVDYVVIHEACHMIQRNHSSRFWSLVAKLDPQYREHRRWLRDNHHLLSI